jgi:hypothetical protein
LILHQSANQACFGRMWSSRRALGVGIALDNLGWNHPVG